MSKVVPKLFGFVVAVAGVCTAPFATTLHAAVEDRDWCLTSTLHFDLVSDLPQEQALGLLASLDRFRAAASVLLPGQPEYPAPPLKLLVFESAADFAETFNSVHIAGFARPSLDQSLLVSGPDRDRHHLHRNVFHEYTHYLLRTRATRNLPIWYEEGLASYLATISVGGDGVVVVGRVPFGFPRGTLVTAGISIADVVAGRFRLNPGRHEPSEIYGLAWALVRFLHHAKAPDGTRYAGKLGTLIAAIDNGADSADAIRSVLGLDLEELKRVLRKYYEDVELPVYRFSIELDERLEFRRDCLDAAEARYELAQAAEIHNPELSLGLYNDILKSNADHVGALIGLSRRVDADRSLGLAESALAKDPDNAEANIRVAELRVLSCQTGRRSIVQPAGGSGCGQEISEAIALYREALESPRHVGAASYGLGIISLFVGQSDDALTYLHTAHTRAPWSPQINFYLGEAYRRTGDLKRARQHFQKTAHWHPDEAWRDRADRALAAIGREE